MVDPNEGFMQQLELYHRMDMADDVESSPSISGGCTSERYSPVSTAEKPRRWTGSASRMKHVSDKDKASSAEFELKCRKCR